MDIIPQKPNQSSGPTPPPPTPPAQPATEQESSAINVNVVSSSQSPTPQTSDKPSAPQVNIAVTTPSEDTQANEQSAPKPSAPTPPPTAIPVSSPSERPTSMPPSSASDPDKVALSPQAPQGTNQMQAPTVFDTNQYHLPIDNGKKHNAGLQMLIFGIVFVIVLVVGGLLAVDAELIDLGFESPINLIK